MDEGPAELVVSGFQAVYLPYKELIIQASAYIMVIRRAVRLKGADKAGPASMMDYTTTKTTDSGLN